jgi:hypothetical protein
MGAMMIDLSRHMKKKKKKKKKLLSSRTLKHISGRDVETRKRD